MKLKSKPRIDSEPKNLFQKNSYELCQNYQQIARIYFGFFDFKFSLCYKFLSSVFHLNTLYQPGGNI